MNGRRRFLYASVIAIHDPSFLYPACQNCFSRLARVSQRFNCHKCGSTTEAADVHYRYKLSLGVADDTEIFKIAIFGSCLDEYFGITADALQRYIQDSTCTSEEHQNNIAQNLLLQATEFCFVGRSFIFGVKSFDNQAEQLSISCNSLLTSNRHGKDLVAYQILVPSVGDIGCTVIKFYNKLLQSAVSKSFQITPPSPDCALTSLDQPGSELSSLCRSRQNHVQSRDRKSLLNHWQLSLGLGSSCDLSTTQEFSGVELSNVVTNNSGENKTPTAKPCMVVPGTQPVQDIQWVSSRSKRRSKGKQADQMHCRFSRNVGSTDPVFASSARVKNTKTLGNMSAPITFESVDNRGLSPLHATLYWQHSASKQNVTGWPVCALGTTLSASDCRSESKGFIALYGSSKEFGGAGSDEKTHGVSADEDHPAVWEELPFSESLNEFIAKIENESNSEAQKHGDSHRSLTSGVHNDFKSIPTTPLSRPKHVSTDAPAGCQSGTSLFQAANSYRVCDPLCCHSLGSAEKVRFVDSDDCSKHLPVDTHQENNNTGLDFCSHRLASKRDSTSSSTSDESSIVHCRINAQQAQRSKPWQNCELAENPIKYPCVPAKAESAQLPIALVHQCSENCLCNFKAKGQFWQTSKENASLVERGFDLETYCNGANENNAFKLVTDSEPLYQDSSNNSFQNSYGSGDLFDATDEGLEIMLESVHPQSHENIYQSGILPASCGGWKSYNDLAYKRLPYEDLLRKSNNFIQQESSSYLVYSDSDSDQENVDSQDFVPSSQSTPLVQKCPQVGSLLGKGTSVGMPAYCSLINSKSGGMMLPLQSNSLGQSTGHIFKRRSSCNLGAANVATNAHPALEDICPFSPSADLFESDSEECIPPSAAKPHKPATFPKSKLPTLSTDKLVKKLEVGSAAIDIKNRDLNKGTHSKGNTIDHSISSEPKSSYGQPSVVLVHTALPASYTTVRKNIVSPPKPTFSLAPTRSESTVDLTVPAADVSSCLLNQIDEWGASWSPELFAEEIIISQHCDLVQKRLF
ncbi:DNA damage-induced apoptosis suppressor protein [Ambystoma mexicanum]|uniref:DNA damage-induced apoptosis suppressor protein n=1 Tax=Ambystoma mexicanum TaxID=8296 RepID=UPI0037E8E3B0